MPISSAKIWQPIKGALAWESAADWGTFNAMCLKVSLLPPGSEGGIRDVSEAYHLVGTHHSQWPGTVVRIDED